MAEIREVDEDVRETRAARFVRLATKRTQTALHAISLVGNLTSANYEYTNDQAKRIINALREAVNNVEKKFNRQSEKVDTFSL